MSARAFAVAALAVVLACATSFAQDKRTDALRADFEHKLRKLFIERGQEHLKLGIECRDKGLTTQAAEQFVLAVSVSRGENPGANTVLSMMRQYEDAFWKKRAPRPTEQRREAYAKRADALRAADWKEWLELALWAHGKGLENLAYDEVVALLRERNHPLQLQGDGTADIGIGKLPAKIAARLSAECIRINGLLYVRDAFLQRLPQITELFETTDARLRVRSTVDADTTQRTHALVSALLPILEDELGAFPRRQLQVVVLRDKATYDAYLDAAGMSDHKIVTGVAESGTCTAVINNEGLTADALARVALHESTHLFHFAVTPSVMPSWYSEGLAETYGGPGTFEWDGATLKAGLPLERDAWADLRDGSLPIPLREMLGADGLALWASAPDKARALYAQSWAWLRFLRAAAGEATSERLELWEAACRGTMIGADLSDPQRGSASAAESFFLRQFEPDLARLERQFIEWLQAQ
jgi:hypothetical protein